MKRTAHDKPIGKIDQVTGEAYSLIEAFLQVAKDRGVRPDTYRKRIKYGVHPLVAAKPERLNAQTPAGARQKESRRQWRKRHPEESATLTDDQVDQVIARNRKSGLGGDRRSRGRES